MSESKVVILMATYNGQNYLAEQLESIVSQTHKNWELWVSDDGSVDQTNSILKNFQNQSNQTMVIKDGPKKGFAENFLSLVPIVETRSDYYAFADQDDIWEPNKLKYAIDWLKTIPENRPALYCSRTKLVDENLNDIGFSPLFERKPSFLNALVQSIAGGNTMVFNHSAFKLLQDAKNISPIVSHDWWVYLLVTGAGGSVFYDPIPAIKYRQHNTNLVGNNTSWHARLHRLKMLYKGGFKKWIDYNCEALVSIHHLLTQENRLVLQKFLLARKVGFFSRLIKINQLGLYRQSFLGNISLRIGMLFKKI